jgi:hypothetical protein
MGEELPTISGSITVARPPAEVYALVADITRMGEWSPVCTKCWWDDDATPAAVGSWFTGRNVLPERTWETHCEVVVAEPGREFAFLVGGNEQAFTRWSYTFATTPDGTELTETWAPQPAILARFAAGSDDGGAAMLDERAELARTGIPATLAAIKASAEAQ